MQFFREATDVQFDETGNRKRKHRYGDEDEIEMEQQERKRRALLNKEIKAFAEKIAEAASTSVRTVFSICVIRTKADSSVEWRDVGTGHSIPRIIFRGCSIPNECALAANY